jgi:hypothetical protein
MPNFGSLLPHNDEVLEKGNSQDRHTCHEGSSRPGGRVCLKVSLFGDERKNIEAFLYAAFVVVTC